MRITDRLNAEHGVFLTQLGCLERLIEGEASSEALRAALYLISGALESHCRFEDRELYPVIRAALGTEAPALKVLKTEHDEVEALLRAATTGPCEPEFVRSFAKKFRAHIENEIHFLFPIVEEWLPAERLQSNWNVDHVHEHVGACGWCH